MSNGRRPILQVKDVARLCHEANRIYCQSIGDNSQVLWAYAPDWQKDSAIQGVQFTLENQEASPEDSHKNWLKIKTAEGWTWGPVKDVEKKEHPCMVPYESLPLNQRVKDSLFQGIVLALLPMLVV